MEKGIITSSKLPSDLPCPEARRFLQQMAIDDPNITRKEADALALHVALCPECEKVFYRLVGMNDDGSFIVSNEASLTELPPPTMTVEEGWQDLLQRCPDLAEAYHSDIRRQNNRRMFRRAGQVAAMAACLALFLVGGWLLVARSHPVPPAAPHTYAELMDDGLLSTEHDAWRQPEPSALDQLDYVTWRDTHREWFMHQFPWIFKVQAVMQKEWGIQADYIDLLMVSADIWQFHYDPKLPVDQPLARLEPTTLGRLARHYRIEERRLLPSVGLHSRTPETSALAGMSQIPSERDGDSTLFAVRASIYLANTRTAAYLWTKAHPQEARQLLSEPAYVASIPAMQTGPSVLEERALVEELRRQATLARSSNQIARELLMTPPTNECVSQVAGQQRKLASLMGELLPQAGQGLRKESDD